MDVELSRKLQIYLLKFRVNVKIFSNRQTVQSWPKRSIYGTLLDDDQLARLSVVPYIEVDYL